MLKERQFRVSADHNVLENCQQAKQEKCQDVAVRQMDFFVVTNAIVEPKRSFAKTN